ncbi:MAG: U32 family peptidase [Bacilli bacterium]
MSKVVLIPKNIEEIKNTEKLVNAYIVGIEGLSVNLPTYFTLKEILEIRSQTNNEIFISLNKNMYNSDLELLTKVLIELEKIDIKGILYYDIALVNLKQKLNLKKDLVWAQEHLTTNSLTCEFWHNEGVRGTYLSSEITLEEVLEIRKNTKMELMINIFGYVPIFTSARHLVTNYLDTFNIEDNSKINYIEKEGKTYPIVNEINTTVYSNSILNGIEEYLVLSDNLFEYVVINSFNIDDTKLLKILEMFKTVNVGNVKEYNNIINSYFNTDKGFLYKETIYKVNK